MKGHPNATAATISGALTVLIVYIASLAGVELPPEVASAITTLAAAAALLIPGKKVER